MAEQERALKCCGGTVLGDKVNHRKNCPSVVRAALSWIEETSIGERHRKRGLAAFEAILAERDSLLLRLGPLHGNNTDSIELLADSALTAEDSEVSPAAGSGEQEA